MLSIIKLRSNKTQENKGFRELLNQIYDTNSLSDFHNEFIGEIKNYVNQRYTINIHGTNYPYPHTKVILEQLEKVNTYNILQICDNLLSQQKLVGELSQTDRQKNINIILWEYVKFI